LVYEPVPGLELEGGDGGELTAVLRSMISSFSGCDALVFVLRGGVPAAAELV